MKTIILSVLGTSGIGKTSLIRRFAMDIYSDKYKPTLEDFYRKSVLIDKKLCVFEVIDTAGAEPFEIMREMYIKTGDCFIVGYSVDNLFSFKEAQKIIQHISTLRLDKPIVFLVGTKADLERDRVISEEVGKEIARQKSCFFMEVSSSKNINVEILFSQIGHMFLKEKKKTFFGKCFCN